MDRPIEILYGISSSRYIVVSSDERDIILDSYIVDDMGNDFYFSRLCDLYDEELLSLTIVINEEILRINRIESSIYITHYIKHEDEKVRCIRFDQFMDLLRNSANNTKSARKN